MTSKDNMFFIRTIDYDRYPNFDPRPGTDLSKALRKLASIVQEAQQGNPDITDSSPHKAHLNCFKQVIKLLPAIHDFQYFVYDISLNLMPLFRDYIEEKYQGKWVVRTNVGSFKETDIFRVGCVKHEGMSAYGVQIVGDREAPRFSFTLTKGKIDKIESNPAYSVSFISPKIQPDDDDDAHRILEPDEVVKYITDRLKRTTQFTENLGLDKETNSYTHRELSKDEFMKILNKVTEAENG